MTSKKSTPVCTFFRPSCVHKTRLTNESEVSSASNRRIGALCAGGGAGRPKACCAIFWAEKLRSSVGAPACQAWRCGRRRERQPMLSEGGREGVSRGGTVMRGACDVHGAWPWACACAVHMSSVHPHARQFTLNVVKDTVRQTVVEYGIGATKPCPNPNAIPFTYSKP